jgi:hypothetical protein
LEPQRAQRTAGGTPSRRLWQWAVPPVLLVLLASRIPLDELGAGLARGPAGWLALYTLVQVAATLALDGFATRIGLAGAGIRRPLRTLIRVRGATYLLALLHYVLGQGGLYVYLRRTGIGAGHAVAAVLVLTTGALGTMALAAAALWPLAASAPPLPGLRPAATALAVLAVLYLGAVIVRPAVFRRSRWLAPIAQLGPRAHLAAWAGRLPHTLALLIGHWGALRLWGIPVPLADGLALVAVVLLVAALPLAPAALGTFEAAQVLLLSGFVPAATADARAAAVLAFALVYHAFGLGAQLGLGFVCLRAGGRAGAEGRPP